MLQFVDVTNAALAEEGRSLIRVKRRDNVIGSLDITRHGDSFWHQEQSIGLTPPEFEALAGYMRYAKAAKASR